MSDFVDFKHLAKTITFLYNDMYQNAAGVVIL